MVFAIRRLIALAQQGAIPTPMRTKQCAVCIKAELAEWVAVVRVSGARAG